MLVMEYRMKMSELSLEEQEIITRHREAKRFINWEPEDAQQILTEEKVEMHDRCYQLAMEQYNSLKERGQGIKDIEQLCYEQVMQLLNPEIFNILSKKGWF